MLIPDENIALNMLQYMGFAMQKIQESSIKTADFHVVGHGIEFNLEVKIKCDDETVISDRDAKLSRGEVYSSPTISATRNETKSGIFKYAAKQLKSTNLNCSSNMLNFIWITESGTATRGKLEQTFATLYGSVDIFEIDSPNLKKCYFFNRADFYRRRDVVDGCFSSAIIGDRLDLKFLVNPFSPRYELLLQSNAFSSLLGNAFVNPIALEKNGRAMLLDEEQWAKSKGEKLDFLREKYGLGFIDSIAMSSFEATIRTPA